MEEIDIWRAAKLLIDRHGDQAWLEASQRADRAIEAGDVAAEGVWRRVVRAVGEMQRRPSHKQPLN